MDYPDYRSGTDALSHAPAFYRIFQQEDAEIFNLLISDPDLIIHDSLQRQLAELIQLRRIGQPPLANTELSEAIAQMLGQRGMHDYGVWVFYPWSRRLVHLLDEAEFKLVRTSRNRYKISDEEQQVLAGKKVGIVGLSVGSSIAITMAMERSFGKLVLADFDTIDLSNLNRIRARLSDLGMNKAVLMAREIAELDPFLPLSVMHEGLSEQNMDAFFDTDGGLDLVIDECDSLEMKIKIRLEAKKRGIPVIMETSDRGMLDIERFDLEPDRPIFHGRLGDLPLFGIEKLGMPERMQYLMAIVGFQEVSERLRYSYSEIGKSLHTWPQLASAVVMGGGTTADTARRVLLAEAVPSGRFYVDMNQLIPNQAH
ncbi:MAG: ThiF family adenylyltransferase [Bacteroidia bacterium]